MASGSVPSQQQLDKDLLKSCESFGLGFFAKASRAAGLEQLLTQKGPFTLFAPTDAAFFALPRGVMKRFFDSPEYLNNVLSNHVLPAKLMSEELCGLQQVRSVTGRLIPVKCHRGILRMDGAMVTDSDIRASNGVLHVLDAVLMMKADFTKDNEEEVL